MWLFCSLIVRPDDSIFCSVKHDHSHLLVCDYCFTLCPDTSTLSHFQNSPLNLSHTCNCCRLCLVWILYCNLWSWISAKSSSSTLSLHISCHFLHKLLSSVFVQKWAASSSPAGDYCGELPGANTDRFHHSPRIPFPSNWVGFRNHHRPCRICVPPTPSLLQKMPLCGRRHAIQQPTDHFHMCLLSGWTQTCPFPSDLCTWILPHTHFHHTPMEIRGAPSALHTLLLQMKAI